MRLTFEFDEKQAATFENIIDVALRSVSLQEAVLLDHLELEHTPEQTTNINIYLADIILQRMLLAEVLGSVKAAEKKTRIITKY